MKTALEFWQEQREGLAKEIARQQDLNGVIYATRHALAQTEQNVLACQSDDVLRQQMGVLFAMLKNSLALLNVPITSTTWTAASRKEEKCFGPGFPLMLAAGAAVLMAGLWNYARGDLLGWVLPLAGLVLGCIAVWMNAKAKRKPAQPTEQLRITQSTDPERLLGAIDGQIVMIDRCVSDFAYLNNSLKSAVGNPGRQNLDAISELLEVVYSYDDDLRQQAEEAMSKLLGDMGLETCEYTPENQRLFNQLPSKTMTRTLCPAILSAEDHRLLRCGTAVVCTHAA